MWPLLALSILSLECDYRAYVVLVQNPTQERMIIAPECRSIGQPPLRSLPDEPISRLPFLYSPLRLSKGDWKPDCTRGNGGG